MDTGLSVADMKLAWRLINATCFDSTLKEPTFTYGPAEFSDPVFGAYYHNPPRIHIDSRCDTLTMILATMAHEMVHQWQDATGKPTNHGNTFRSMGAHIKRKTGVIV